MLKLFNSSDLYQLADSLQKELRIYPPHNPLHPEIFVVQNHGMARWLSLHIAEREGIAANLEFKFPAEVYWQIMRVMDPDIPEKLPSERIPMSWAIFQVLQNDDDHSLSKLHQYVQKEDPLKQEMRCWNLASRIGDVFDQYLTYRPEMLRRWENPDYNPNDPSQKWQVRLWQILSDRWKRRGKKEGTHRADLQDQLIKQIDNRNIAGDKLPPRISIFGVSEMPEVYIKTFIKASKLIEVHFYLVDTSANQQNILIQSMGKVGMEFNSLFRNHVKADSEINEVEIADIEADQETPANFFEVVKQDLITAGQTNQAVGLDRSVQIHACHSPRREVEVLYDQLLKMLDENRALKPGDIVVMCPQMEVYGPEIEAVFGAVEEGLPEIPYHMSETAEEANTVDLTFRRLLHIVDSRFKVTDLLDLLDCDPIRKAFSLTGEHANTLERWIGDNRIHWGINGDQKQTLGLPDTNSFTWRAGLNRMMAGYAMQTKEDQLFDDIYPYDEIQQSEHAQLLGRFSQFLNHLFQCHRQIGDPKSLSEWSDVLNNWLTAFFPDEETYLRDMQELREIIHSVHKQQQLAEMSSKTSFRVICSYLEDRLDQKSTGGGRPGKGVTFSGMVPMRNIPAEAVCMIGMNDGVFPRPKKGVEFNLITKNPREGDRLPAKEDRQIFLENILAARVQVYFSYVGQSNKKGVEYPPSVVLREFVDYLIERYNIREENIIQFHKLQSFSPYYFKINKDHSLFSYSARNGHIAQRLLDTSSVESAFLIEALPKPDESFKKLSVGEFILFFQHPAKFLLQQRLGIFLREEEVLDEDRESFVLDALEKYQVGQQMLDRFLNDQSLQSYKDIAIARDQLPEGWPGDHAFTVQALQVKEFGQEIQRILTQKQLDTLEVDYKIGDFQIVGRLDQIYKKGQILYRFGKMRPKDLIELWIKHLVLLAAKPKGYPGKSRLYTREDKKGIVFHQFISIPNAGKILENLLNMYWAGLQKNILFYPCASFAYAHEVFFKNKDEEDGMKAADREWIDRYRNYQKEGNDPYNIRLLGNINPLEHSQLKYKFKQISQFFWSPFFKELNKTDGAAG